MCLLHVAIVPMSISTYVTTMSRFNICLVTVVNVKEDIIYLTILKSPFSVIQNTTKQKWVIKMCYKTYLSMSKCRFLLLSTFPQQHFSARTAYNIIKVRMRMVRIQPTTTAMATNNSGDKCSENRKNNIFEKIGKC